MPAEGQPDFQGGATPTPEEENIPEELRAWRRGSVYTVEGERLILDLKEAFRTGEIDPIRHQVERSTAYLEGLTYGLRGKNYIHELPANVLNMPEGTDKTKILRSWELEMVSLKNQFENIESSTARPRAQYLLAAVDEELTLAVCEINEYRDDNALWGAKTASELGREYDAMKSEADRSREQLPQSRDVYIQTQLSNAISRMEKLSNHRPELIGLKGHVDARRILDELFIIRQKGSEDDEKWLRYASSPLPTPDKGAFHELFQGNISPEDDISKWGDAVNNVINLIEDVTTGKVKVDGVDGKNFIINGFKTTGEFALFLQALLNKATIDGKKRMDVVWMAWRYSLVTEKLTHNAWGVRENGAYVVGAQPFTSDVAGKMIHNDKLRARDYGWPGRLPNGKLVDLDTKEYVNPDGTKRRMTEEELQDYFIYAGENRIPGAPKVVAYSGHPLTLARFGRLKDDFERATTVVNWTDPRTERFYKKISVHEAAYGLGVSRADFNFPWSNTQLPRGRGEDPENEVPSGAFSVWYLNHIRAILSRNELIRRIQDPAELTMDELSKNKRLRDLYRLGQVRPGELVNGVPDNPIAWQAAADYLYRALRWGGNISWEECQLSKGAPRWIGPDQALRSTSQIAKLDPTSAGKSARSFTEGDTLSDLFRLGFISKSEHKWLKDNFTALE